ncbi:hypothetical protein LINPERHAP1_LOCUS5841 [Linum perenne]
MESRMQTIVKSCSTWKGAFRKATSRQGSGTTQSDVVSSTNCYGSSLFLVFVYVIKLIALFLIGVCST